MAVDGSDPPDLGEFLPTVDEAPHSEWAKAQVVVARDGGTLCTGNLTAPLDLSENWDGVLKGFGLDPTVFEVVGDTVRMNKWQQSKRLENGDRDTVWLYSYRASFRRRPPTVADLDLDGLRASIARWKPRSAPPAKSPSLPSTFVVCWADWQLGKSAAGGVVGAVARVQESFDLAVRRIAELRRLGRNVERVAVINMGDPTESCYGQYASQLFTVELTQREQLNLCLDLWAAGIKALNPDLFASCLCNHGEWTRQGTGDRPATSDSDNVSGYLADTLRRLFEEAAVGPKDWVIPHDEMVGLVNLSGVDVAITHGHKIPSEAKELDWLRAQSIRLLRDHGREPKLWVTAHRHHLRVDDFGPWFRLQCPSLDGGPNASKWFEDLKGVWATPGTLTFLAGKHDPRGFSDLAVLGSGGSER